jgi:TolA-binding protein
LSRFQIATKAAADLSQMGLLVLATFGYFYTVVPVYQKELLSEDIAKKQLEFSKMTDALAEKEAQISEAQKTLADLNRSIEQLRQENSAARAQVQRAQQSTNEEYEKLRDRLIGDLLSLAIQKCSFGSVPKGQFGPCVARVLSDVALTDLRNTDKDRLRRLINEENQSAAPRWEQEISRQTSTNQQKLDTLQGIIDEKCAIAASFKNSEDINAKITTDMECGDARRELINASLHMELNAMSLSERLTTEVMTKIVNRFLAGR